MKFMMKPRLRLRPRPLNSFLGFQDIKVGVQLALLFAVLNKVAGVYGLVAVFTGGSFAQLSLYFYSTAVLAVFFWGLKVAADEDPRRTLYCAHVFFADHVLSTAWTVFFAVIWWVYTPHDGRRIANSAAQEEVRQSGPGSNMTDAEREQAAMMIWNKEKGLAAAFIVIGWLCKIYFVVLLYSYAIHLRQGSYRTLPTSSSSSSSKYMALNGTANGTPNTVLGDDDDDETMDDYYPRTSMPVPQSAPAYTQAYPHHAPQSHSRTPLSGSSITSFADFVSAPGRGRRFRPVGSGGVAHSLPGSALKDSFSFPGAGGADEIIEDEVLFDSDELARGSSSSKFEESTTSESSRDDDTYTLRARERDRSVSSQTSRSGRANGSGARS